MIRFSRRGWLCSATAALAAGVSTALLPRATSAPRPRPITLGFSLYGMKKVKTADALRVCAAIGYDCVEFALMPGWPTEPKRLAAADRLDLRRQLGDTRLTLAALMENLHEPADQTVHQANLDRLKAAAELGHTLSPQVPPVLETVLGGKPAQWEQVKGPLAERLRKWAEVGAATRTTIAVKPHVGGALHTPEGARWLLKQVNSPWLKLAFDYSHFALRDYRLAPTVAALVPESVFIHVKDSRGTAAKFEFVLPGEGTVDYVEYFKLIQAAGYGGPVVVEVSGQISNRPNYDPIAAARRSYDHLAPALQKAGVPRK